MGGLAAAIDLAAAGMEVTVVERAPAPGGKMREVEVAGQAIDAGPTVFTMRWVFESLFADAGAVFGDHLVLEPATTLARHAWGADERLDLFVDRARSADAIGDFAGAAAAKGYLAFCKEARGIYELLERPHIRAARPGTAKLVAGIGLFRALKLKPYEPLWTELRKHFKDPRLLQLFGRYATYCGTDPFQAPATLMLVAHVEQEGVWLVQGGMHRVAKAMEALAIGLGVTFRYGTGVSEIMVASGRAVGVRLPGTEVIHADAVIMNGDPGALRLGLLGNGARAATAPPLKFPQRSLSATTWAMLADTSGMPLLRHTVFFSSDYRLEFKMIQNGLLPTEPTTYICAQDRPDSETDAPPNGPERLLMLVNAPAAGDRRAFSQVEIDQCMQGISSVLQRCGVQITATEPPVLTTPAMYHRMYPASGGALYGQAVLIGSAGLKRPDSRTKLDRLYLAGGSCHPGAGVPMAALSGRQAAASALTDLVHHGSTRKYRQAATLGGTSTR